MNKEEIIIDGGLLTHYTNENEYYEYDSLYYETLNYLDRLQQENKQLKSILVELEEWLKDVDIFQMNFIENKNHITPFKAVLDKIQKLKEEYK